MSTALIQAAAWMKDATCRRMLPLVRVDYWGAGSDRDSATLRATAQHICLRHCPVLAQCRAEVESVKGTEAEYHLVVIAGMDLAADGHVKSRLGRARTFVQCPICGPPPPSMGRMAGDVTHGSDEAIRRHRRSGEPLCTDCDNAHKYRLKLKRQNRALNERKKAKRREAQS